MYHKTAQGLAALGRGDDKLLIHMTPGEVQGLQKLAMSHGGSLTVNPHTGLPEAGFLSSILPMVIGIGGAAMGIPTPLLLGGGALAGMMTNQQNPLMGGLMGGLGAYGGMGLGSALNSVGAETAGALASQETATASTAAAEAERQAAIKAAIEAQNAAAQQANAVNSWGVEYANAAPAKSVLPYEYSASSGTMPTTTTPQYQPVAVPDPYTQQQLSQIGDTAYQQAIDRSSMFGGATPASQAALNATPMQNMQTGLGKVTGSWDEAKKFMMGNKGAVLGVAAPLGLAALQGMSKQPTLNMAGAQSAPSRFYNTAYSPGTKNPRFGIPGEPYYIGQGYAPGYYDATVHAAEGGMIENYPGARIESNYERGGLASFAAGGDTRFAGVNDEFRPAADYYMNLLNTPQNTAGGIGNIGGIRDYLSNLNASLQYTPTTYSIPATTPSTTPSGGWTYNASSGFTNTAPAPAPAPLETSPAPFIPSPERTGEAGGFAEGGIASLDEYAAGGKLLQGAGDGMSDSIPAVIKGAKPQRAALAQGEFVIPADVVSHLGNGSTDAGAKHLYAMMDRVRKARTGNPKQGKQINAGKYMPA